MTSVTSIMSLHPPTSAPRERVELRSAAAVRAIMVRAWRSRPELSIAGRTPA
jgi:hypothetical protein